MTQLNFFVRLKAPLLILITLFLAVQAAVQQRGQRVVLALQLDADQLQVTETPQVTAEGVAKDLQDTIQGMVVCTG